MRLLTLSVVVLLGYAPHVWAGPVKLTWRYPVAQQTQATFTVRIVTLVQGQPTQREETLTLVWSGGSGPGGPGGPVGDLCKAFTPDPGIMQMQPGEPHCDMFKEDIEGKARPCDGKPWTVGACELGGGLRVTTPRTSCGDDPALAADPLNMCAEVCLDTGIYTLSIFAHLQGQTSEVKSPFDLTLTATAPCGPVVVVVPPAPPPAPPPAKPPPSVPPAVVVPIIAAPLVVPPLHVPPIPELPNLRCVSWKIVGPCACGFPPQPCVQVSYWEPAFIVETVKIPGFTALDVLSPILSTALGALGIPIGSGGGAGNTTGAGHTNIHYSEVHLLAYPQLLGGPCTACAPGSPPLALHYASEADAATWRTAVAVPSPLDIPTQIGVWARLYPRGGKVIHSSPVIASGVEGIRAMDIAFQPIGTPPNVDRHVVLKPTGLNSRCIQLAYPRKGPCQDAGLPPPLVELGAGSPRGVYEWVIWRKRTCCVNPATSTCGITLIGGQGANQCLLPTTP